MPRLRTAAVIVALLAALPAAAEPAPRNPIEDAAELARRAVERFFLGLQPMFEKIPQYGAPEVQPNGDIVIPRLNPKPPAPPVQREDPTLRTSA